MLGDSAKCLRTWRLFNYEKNSRYFKFSQTYEMIKAKIPDHNDKITNYFSIFNFLVRLFLANWLPICRNFNSAVNSKQEPSNFHPKIPILYKIGS